MSKCAYVCVEKGWEEVKLFDTVKTYDTLKEYIPPYLKSKRIVQECADSLLSTSQILVASRWGLLRRDGRLGRCCKQRAYEIIEMMSQGLR